VARLELRGVRHRYEGRVVLDLPAFAVPDGGKLAIVGHNGSGKSTLLRLLALLERPSEGNVLFDGNAVAGSGAAERRRITLVEQRPVLLPGTVHDNLAFGLHARGVTGATADSAVRAIARRHALTALLDRRRRDLSAGEIQRVAVARALVFQPDVLLLDEPTSSADRAAAQGLYRALQAELERRPMTVCLASHQLEDAYRWADDIQALAEGRLSPVTPENLFRVELPPGDADATKRVRVGTIDIALMSERQGPAIVAIPPEDILVSTTPVVSSARNVFAGCLTRIAHQRPGALHVAADMGGGVELIAAVTPEAVRELGLAPGTPVVFAFKAAAVRVF
jgi:tungstate transport system ATP-binding protein